MTDFVLKGLGRFNDKIDKGVKGRAQTFAKLKSNIIAADRTLWFHCASLGEYEQGLPVFEALKMKHPSYKVVLTFFSPSGYEIRKHSPIADVVVYLPLDSVINAKRFLDLVHPDLIVFVKYDIWPNYLLEIKKRDLRAILISAVFRKNQIYFAWYGAFMRKALFGFTHIFTQNENSEKLLKSIGFNHVSIAGDTRFDRVSNQLKMKNTVPFIASFKGNKDLIVFGSTWPEDDKLYVNYINENCSQKLKFVIAPHQMTPSHLSTLKSQIKLKSVAYSDMNDKDLTKYSVFILDTVGYLSKVYSYADIAYVGGGAGKTGLHNILEAAVFGVPILIGKNYENFSEAKQLLAKGGVISIKSADQLATTIEDLLQNPKRKKDMGNINKNFVEENKGAVGQIQDYISRYIRVN